MNKKRTRLILAVVLCIALAFSLAACGGNNAPAPAPEPTPAPATSSDPAPEPAAPAEKHTWNVGTIGTDPAVMPDLNSQGEWLEALRARVDEYTNGQVEIVIHYSGVLGGQPQLFEQCEMGELEVFQGQPMSSNDARFACWNIPFQFDSLEQVDKAIDNNNGELFKMSEGWIAEHGMHLLCMGGGFMRGYANSKREVILPEDVKGIKTRVYEDALVRTFWDGLTQTQILPVPDIYSGLQTGTVDGLEMFATNLIVNKYDEVVKYYTDIDWQWVNSQMIIVSDKAWTALSPELQEAVQRACVETVRIQTENQIKYTNECFAILESRGIQITKLTPEQKQAWIDYADSQTDLYKDIIGADVYDAYMAMIERSK